MKYILKIPSDCKVFKVSYKTKSGAVGFGYLINGKVYSHCGVGYCLRDVEEIIKDGGKTYMNVVRGLRI